MPDVVSPVLRVMTTPLDDNGLPQPHPADYHAEITAEKIIQVAETAAPEIQKAGRALRKKVESILTQHHAYVEQDEVANLKAQGAVHAAREVGPDAPQYVVQGLMDAIVGASRGTILEPHFARNDVQAVIKAELEHETRSQMFVHRTVFSARDKLSRQPKLVP